jgi:hypothetical protein
MNEEMLLISAADYNTPLLQFQPLLTFKYQKIQKHEDGYYLS